ncbi:class I SAM-dependent methyltransferase [Patescibacteria group bacterium]
MKRQFGKKKKTGNKAFWETEYKSGKHLTLSNNPSEDLEKFVRWIARQKNIEPLNKNISVLDIGCGNGRNLIYLAQEFGAKGLGYDISSEAISQAQKQSKNLPLTFQVHSITEPIPAEDESQDLVLDMMTSHFLNEAGRKQLVEEINRVLKPGAWLFFKTFLLDEDLNAKQLLRDFPADEPGSYIHPRIGVLEHVFTQQEIDELLAEHFTIHRVKKSHRHRDRKGRANKRRTISVYAQKI